MIRSRPVASLLSRRVVVLRLVLVARAGARPRLALAARRSQGETARASRRCVVWRACGRVRSRRDPTDRGAPRKARRIRSSNASRAIADPIGRATGRDVAVRVRVVARSRHRIEAARARGVNRRPARRARARHSKTVETLPSQRSGLTQPKRDDDLERALRETRDATHSASFTSTVNSMATHEMPRDATNQRTSERGRLDLARLDDLEEAVDVVRLDGGAAGGDDPGLGAADS